MWTTPSIMVFNRIAAWQAMAGCQYHRQVGLVEVLGIVEACLAFVVHSKSRSTVVHTVGHISGGIGSP